jgi:hypothetical protein
MRIFQGEFCRWDAELLMKRAAGYIPAIEVVKERKY